jgi:hypothetical protein
MTINLRASAKIESGALVIDYEVSNDGDVDIYLLNRLFDAVEGKLSPDIAYVALDNSAHIVEVRKVLADIPTPNPTSPVAPYVTPVRAHGHFSEVIHLRLPVRRYQQYESNRAEGGAPGEYEGVRLTLAYYARQPGVIEERTTAFGQPVILPKGFKGFPAIARFSSAVMQLPIPVAE